MRVDAPLVSPNAFVSYPNVFVSYPNVFVSYPNMFVSYPACRQNNRTTERTTDATIT